MILAELAVILTRLVQYASGSVLLGLALFLLCAWPGDDRNAAWARPVLIAGALALALSSAIGFLAQTTLLAGSLNAALTAESFDAMLGTKFGQAALFRSATAALAIAGLLLTRPGSIAWLTTAGFATVAVASFAWMGHGAAGDGTAGRLRLAADIVHVLAASVWIGTLVSFLALLRGANTLDQVMLLHRALVRFSAIGVPLVLALTATGLLNGWLLVGPANVLALPATTYGQLLLVKLAAFAAMLLLAAVNRIRLTPMLARSGMTSVAKLRRSVGLEAALGFGVLALVAWLGTLAAPGQ